MDENLESGSVRNQFKVDIELTDVAVGNQDEDKQSAIDNDGDQIDGKKTSEDEFILEEVDDEDSSGKTRRLSQYATAGKKAAAQGLMDIALLTANANQMRYVLEFGRQSYTFHITLCLIIISLILQVTVATFLLIKGHLYMKGQSKSANGKRVKNYVLIGSFMITVINVFIASFTTMETRK